MRRKAVLFGATIASCALAVIVLAGVEGAQKGAPEAQTFKHRQGVPLETVLGDILVGVEREIVVAKDQSPPHLIQPPTWKSELEWFASVMPMASVITVTNLEAQFTEMLDWIQTTVTARVDDVLKAPVGAPLAPGGQIQFVHDGGNMVMGNVRVRAELPWATGFEVGQSYVVFADRDEGGWRVLALTSYRVDAASQQLRPLAKNLPHGPRDPETSLRVAKERIRTAARKQR